MNNIPPVGTSAYKAYLRATGQSFPSASTSALVNTLLFNNANHFGSYGSDLPLPVIDQVVSQEHKSDPFDAFGAAEDVVEDASTGGRNNNVGSIPYPNSSYGLSAPKIAEFDYLNAELAKHYGMSKTTAYEEALANTAYQRAVKDLKAAGLNPGVLFGNGRVQSASASIYGKEAVASGAGGSYRRASGSSGKKGNLFSSSVYGAVSAIGGMIGIVATGRPDGFWIGSQTAQGAMQLMNAFNQRK